MTQSEIDAIVNLVEPVPIVITDLKIGTLCRMLIDTNYIITYAEDMDSSADVLDIAAFVKGVTKGIEEMLAVLNDLQPEEEEEERRAAKGINWPSLPEAMLLEVVEFYHLHSTAEAEQLPVSDWFMLRKKRYAEQRFKRNYEKLLQKKYDKHQ